ncbi:anhydro-N-acetylmuramic acid kinase [Legionella sp. km772]|uniref:anhydro-N-acetylmuramic acid kinase n=1 Tax=Legionella sp. km772 TaxID=2498111 RepID=UPI000F8C5976|nr:anhydro-N-acetylmuramic acid kinase [Legionella sp. km772]RUR09220.1 anhydro-N-acetylmuramic acid kinase [Legionella sp. km772]
MDFYIGLMSGTSMDGIDTALIQLPSNKLIHGLTQKYSEGTKKLLLELVHTQHTSLSNLGRLNRLIGIDFASAVNQILDETGYSASAIRAIGSHGQTVSHDTKTDVPYTLQLGCPHTISSLTGIDVVADFRTRDLVNGGQGAPFAPLYHQELFAQYDEHAVIVNVGGIANASFLNPGQKTKGWDVGPGNCLMDAWIELHQNKEYDADGRWAAQGKLIAPLLENLLSDPFFTQAAPKSIGKEYFSLSWLKQYLKQEYPVIDVQATLLELTALGIARSITEEDQNVKKLYLCGGGAHNSQLINRLIHLLPQIEIRTVMDLGVNPDYLEAMMFAWLASQTINSIAVDLRAITGSKNKAILGAIYPTTK